jgi:hypothetical protein
MWNFAVRDFAGGVIISSLIQLHRTFGVGGSALSSVDLEF